MKRLRSDVPIQLLGDTRRAALETKLAAFLAEWVSQWSRQRDLRVKIDAAAHLLRGWGNDGQTSRWRIGSGYESATAVLLCRSGFAQELLDAHGNTDSGAVHGPIATKLQEELVSSLAFHLARHLDPRDGVSCAEDSSTLRDYLRDAGVRRWIGAAVYAAGNRPLGLMLLDPIVVARLVPVPRPSSAEALEKRRTAVLGNTVAVEVLLGDADVSFSDLLDIAVDDVIVLEQLLNSPVQLVCNGVRIAEAHLGRSGDHLAVSVTG